MHRRKVFNKLEGLSFINFPNASLDNIEYIRIPVRGLGLAFLLSVVFYLFNPTSCNIFRVYSLFFHCSASKSEGLNYISCTSCISSLQDLCLDATILKSNRKITEVRFKAFFLHLK